MSGGWINRPEGDTHRQQDILQGKFADTVSKVGGREVVEENHAHLVIHAQPSSRVRLCASWVVDALCDQMVTGQHVELKLSHRLVVEVIMAVLESCGQLCTIPDVPQLDFDSTHKCWSRLLLCPTRTSQENTNIPGIPRSLVCSDPWYAKDPWVQNWVGARFIENDCKSGWVVFISLHLKWI